MTDVSTNHGRVSRRTMLRLGAAGTAATGMAAAKIIAILMGTTAELKAAA